MTQDDSAAEMHPYTEALLPAVPILDCKLNKEHNIWKIVVQMSYGSIKEVSKDSFKQPNAYDCSLEQSARKMYY